ncbi:hypothetical protein QDX21_07120 [Auritidibacter ignavus]|uniref:Phosphoadenosine phosphosulfate reductase n=1 Tax=Auritidibacter ignavus TaxID=678932 RepID=A0AAJ6AF59_9MICC|nr:hypothetical protein [Auritidibacter ignavus]WGH92106.1 hypothetical protein QDX21_07120 [Auritidibacter ignavus]
MIEIDSVPSSASIREDIARSGDDVLLAFSRGKDSIALWLSLLESGVDPDKIHPYHLYLVPGLSFVDESLAYFEDYFEKHIPQYPHVAVYRLLKNLVFQPPENCSVIEAAQLQEVTYLQLISVLSEEFGLPKDTYYVEGSRACDSPMRRIAVSKHGAVRKAGRKILGVWDWQIADVRDVISRHGIELPVDYEMFGRSFDGLDYRFLGPLKERFPDDYQKILDLYPLAELEVMRYEIEAV